MSQHHWTTTRNGRTVSLLMGWDRPLQGYFLVVNSIAGGDFTDTEELYCNMNDEKLGHNGGLADDLDYLEDVLIGLELQVPEDLIFGVYLDAAFNEGNREVWYDVDGTRLTT